MDKELLKKKAQNYIDWETHQGFRKEVEELVASGNFDELHERFYTELSFGTGGIRGVMGGGFNRMNTFMVQRASEGLARYVDKHGSLDHDSKRSIVIAYDSRNNSELFAKNAAEVFCAHGIAVKIFRALRPTPQLSFAVRKLGASAGIVVTASHNPKKYNGYKVYWNDGGQVVPPHDQGIIDTVQEVQNSIKSMEFETAEKQGLITWLGDEMDESFLEMVMQQSLRKDLFEKSSSMPVVFTPLHGTGYTLVQPLAKKLGIDLKVVASQAKADGDFPTVTYPNPEEASALKLAIDQARQQSAALVLGTDPDADRIGIAVAHNNDFVLLNGNQHGVLLVDYYFSTLQELGRLPDRPVFINTIVTTELQRVIAKSYGADVYQTLTGFKWIAAKMKELEKPGAGDFVMGDEESYGFLIGDQVRDKDAITATLITLEMALYHHSQGKTLIDRLNEIYKKYGFYQEIQISKEFEGSEGSAKIAALMARLRSNVPQSLGGVEVALLRDIKDGTSFTLATKQRLFDIDLPSSDVLQFVLSDGSIISARPSGTEPKIKFYASVAAGPGRELAEAESLVKAKIVKIGSDIEAIIAEIA